MKLNEILDNDIKFLYKENSRLKKLMIFFTLLSFLCYFFLCFANYTQGARLNEHKKVIELMNEANKSQQESINLLMKNQILLNNKLKRYDKNK